MLRFDNLRIPISENQRIKGITPYYGANGIQDYVDGFTHNGEFILIAEDGANDIKNYPVQYVNGKIWVNNHAHVLKAKDNNSTLFMKYRLNSLDMTPYLSGCGRYKLNAEVLMKINSFVPSPKEQIKIAAFLSLVDERIKTQNKIIEHYESLIKSLRDTILYKNKWKWIKLKDLVDNKSILLQRGNIIPKHIYDSKFIYPVYSSSVHNDGLMGFYDSYMFDEELITWSIDGGGNFFLRNKHKFNVTNVCGILKILDNSFDYSFLYEILSYQHSKMVFDYQTKAHPSVIQTIYSIPLLELKEQQKIGSIFIPLYEKIKIERNILEHYKLQKEYLLKNLFI